MKIKKNIDDLFKERFENLEVSPSPEVWKNIQTKLKEEDFVGKLSKDKGLKSIHCRFGTIFGVSPGMRFHTAVNKFCWQAVMNQPISVWSTAYDQKRPYLDLLDASRAIAFIIKNTKYLTDIQFFNIEQDHVSVELIFKDNVSFDVFYLENPARLVVDIKK